MLVFSARTMVQVNGRFPRRFCHRRRAATLPKPEWQDCTILIREQPLRTRRQCGHSQTAKTSQSTPTMYTGSMILLPATIMLSLAVSRASVEGDCHVRPPDFLSGEQYWSSIPEISELPVKNRIYVLKSGQITWNHAVTTIDELETLLRKVSDFDPLPLTQFEWDAGAPCDSLELVRSMMRQRLTCANTRNCMEGADPRELSPPSQL